MAEKTKRTTDIYKDRLPTNQMEMSKMLDKVSALNADLLFLLEKFPFGICWVNEKEKIQYVNSEFSGIFSHWFKGPMEGKTFSEIMFIQERKHVQENLRRMYAGQEIRGLKYSVIKPDGETIWYEYSYYKLSKGKEYAGCIIVIDNVSEAIKIDEENNRLVDVRDVYEDYFNYEDSILLVLSANENFKPLYISQNCAKDIPISFLKKQQGKLKMWSQIIYSKDISRFKGEMNDILKFGSKLAFVYYRIIDEAGTIRWVKQTTLPKSSANGDIKYIACSLKDVSVKSAILNEMYSGSEKSRQHSIVAESDDIAISDKYITYNNIKKVFDEDTLSSIVSDFEDTIGIGCLSFEDFEILGNKDLVIKDAAPLSKMDIDSDRLEKTAKSLYDKFLKDNQHVVSFTNSDGKEVKLIAFGIGQLLISIFVVKPKDNVYSNIDWVCKYLKIALKHITNIMRKNLSALNEIDEYKDREQILISTIESQKKIPALINTFYSSNNYFVGFKKILELIAKFLKLDRIQILNYSEKNQQTSNYMNYYRRESFIPDIDKLLNVFNKDFYSLFSDENIIHVSNYSNVHEALREYSSVAKAASSAFYAIKVDDRIKSIITFDDMLYQREWTPEMLFLVENICSVLSTLIINEKTTNSMLQTQTSFEKVLDEMSSFISIVDVETRETLFENKLLKKNQVKFALNTICTHSKGKECKKCDTKCILDILNDDNKEGVSYEYHDVNENKWYMISMNRISWEGSKKAVIVNVVDISSTKTVKEQEDKLLYTDTLTGLNNHIRYVKYGDEYLLENKNKGRKVAHITLNIANFRNIVSEHDYEVGNEVLVKVSDVIKNFTTSSSAFTARTIEDTFVILYPYSDEKDLHGFIRKIFTLFDKLTIPNEPNKKIKIAGGIAYFPDHGKTFSELSKKAGLALQLTKQQENLSYKIYDMIVESTIEKAEKFKNEIMLAYKNREFVLYFQPKLNLKTNKVDSAEALIRWEHPKRGLLSAGEFVDILEEMDSQGELGYYIMEEVIKAVKAFNLTEKGKNFIISFNVLGKTLVKYDFFEKLSEMVKYYRINPSNLEIELTEKMLIDSTKYSTHLIEQFKKLGVNISIDDFGTGYSSLSYLKQFDVDAVKIDKIFLADIDTDRKSRNLAVSIIKMSKLLNFKVLFEGVETKAEFDFVKTNGCDFIQGYYIGKAMPVSELYKLL